jgi:hypothetical protein
LAVLPAPAIGLIINLARDNEFHLVKGYIEPRLDYTTVVKVGLWLKDGADVLELFWTYCHKCLVEDYI